jgi:hypothetical protein
MFSWLSLTETCNTLRMSSYLTAVFGVTIATSLELPSLVTRGFSRQVSLPRTRYPY